MLGMLSEPFDSQGVAQKTFDKHYNDESSQYFHKSVEEIMDMWAQKGKTSCHYGSMLDDYIGINLTQTPDDLELWKLDNNYDYDERLHAHCDAFDNFYHTLVESGEWEFVDREKTVYLRVGDYYIKGRFDALFKNKRTGKFVVFDWKSSGTIDKKETPWTKKLLGPAFQYPALNYYTYTMQLFFYKKALIESKYLPEGMTEDDVNVMIVNLPDHIIESAGKNYETHRPAFPYDSELMDRIFNFAVRKNELINKKNA